MMDVWHKSIRQCSQNIACTLIACNARHGRLTWGYIVNGQSGCYRMVVRLIVIVVSCSNVAHLILTFRFNCDCLLKLYRVSNQDYCQVAKV